MDLAYLIGGGMTAISLIVVLLMILGVLIADEIFGVGDVSEPSDTALGSLFMVTLLCLGIGVGTLIITGITDLCI